MEYLTDRSRLESDPRWSVIGKAERAEIADLIDGHGLLAAIKRYREITGSGLAESKRAVESVIGGAGLRCPQCGTLLRTENAQQCFECGSDWHNQSRQSVEERIKTMLSPVIRALWDDYLDQERQKVRSHMLPALEQFVAALEGASPVERESWALMLAEEVVDHEVPVPVRLPLFRKVLFPALLFGYRQQIPGCARWLAGFFQLLCNSPECLNQLAPDERNVVALLRAALQTDPSDVRSRKRLVRVLASSLEYAIHEVPSGVLFGNNGATIAECDELIDELEQFCGVADADGCIEQYRELISDCRLHFTAYREYLKNRGGFVNYEDYLDQLTGMQHDDR
jgi:hypothetical protein